MNKLWSLIGVLVAGMLLLSGCAPDTDEPGTDTMNIEGSVNDEPEAVEGDEGSSQQNATIPSDFYDEAPIPDYELIAVDQHDDPEVYVLHMRGTDLEADAMALEKLLTDAGYHRLAWGITEERGANGIFIIEGFRVRILVQEAEDGVRIEYEAGPVDRSE